MDPAPAPARTPGLPLRILRFPLTLLAIEAVVFTFVGGPLEAASSMFPFGFAPPTYFFITLVGAVLLILLWKAFRRWVEGDRDHEFTFPGAWREAGAGLVFGFLLFSLMTGIVALFGGIEVIGVRRFGDTQFWAWAGLGVASGIFEETLLRGILLRHLEKLTGTWLALTISAVIFGLLHLANQDATWVGAVSIAIEAGILLGAAYLYTRRLWLAAGIHAAWNFTQAWVFSVPVSGTGQPIGILATRRLGPDWLTGGDFGLEASLASVFVATAAGLVLLWLAHKRGRFLPAPWQRGGGRDALGTRAAAKS